MTAADYVEASPTAVVDRRYRVRREIARGGVGVVAEAEHQWLKTPIAIKTLTSSALESPAVHARLIREARALSVARHPGVIDVLDAGVCPRHGPYIALELFDGRSLESFVVARTRLEVDDVVHIATQLGAALSYAHSRGVVHRDVKPANVVVGRAPGRDGDVVKLLDFGIASVPSQEDVVDRKLTGSHEVLGTIEYMAPEQLLHGLPPTPASDVYGLGALLYECLTGDVPFVGNSTTVMTLLLQGKQPRSIRAQRPETPAALEAAVLGALRPDPDERFANVQELVDACVAAVPERSACLSMHAGAGPARATRRQWTRAAYVTPVRVLAASGACDGRTEDVSEGGLLVVTAASCTEGEQVRVRLPLPGSGRVVTVQAVARWARTRRGQRALGLEFVDLPPDARLDICGYVELMTPRDASGPRHT